MVYFVKPDPINVLNFLRWHEMEAGQVDGGAIVNSESCLQVQVVDSRPPSACKTYNPAEEEVYAIPAKYYDPFEFIVNAPRDFGTELSLFLLQGNTFTLVPSFVSSYITVGADKYLTGSFNMPCVPEGRYNLALALPKGPGDDVIENKWVVAVSNPLRVMNHQSNQHPTIWAEYRHSVSQFGFPYSADAAIKNRFRIDALLTKARPAESITTYEDRNHVTRFVGRGSLQRVCEFKTADLDQETHESIAAMFLHSELKMDGRNYAKVEAYETELYNDDYPLFQGLAKVKDLGFISTANACAEGA